MALTPAAAHRLIVFNHKPGSATTATTNSVRLESASNPSEYAYKSQATGSQNTTSNTQETKVNLSLKASNLSEQHDQSQARSQNTTENTHKITGNLSIKC